MALLESKTHQSIDIYFHATYFVVARFNLEMLLALTSGLFGLIYFAASRWASHPLNNLLGLTHFVLATTGFVMLSASLSALRSPAAGSSSAIQSINHWAFLAATLGLLCFLIGCAVLFGNCGMTAIRAFLPHNI